MAAAAGLAVALVSFVAYRIIRFGLDDPRFRLADSSITVQGIKYVPERLIREKFAGDIGRSVFLTPLASRQAMLEEISWVEEARVARAWPNRLHVAVRERTAVAFLRTSTGLSLVDRNGVIMDRPSRAVFTFPVLTGFTEKDAPETRLEKIRLYASLMEDLDHDGGRHSVDISEVDVSDPEDAKVTVAGRDASDAILLHLGNSGFLSRYRTYLAYIRQWKQQFEKIHSIDLRYERQIIVNPDRNQN